ncbi:metallophosphoesterase family protein [Pseudofrankia inefficax]|uniref:Metallophosphoesterase n=1 Tax=Pseudofrankia inefficax (strain DSM 45817 / CECT 9037 / DDB 130130 / EuI1c) TaxID=298654 RepID=E3JBY1_PSEI1|nr:metallophosphoesterase [Pseudofrankia inefficax]ADP82291.1 metallophosphoesterase [Pseudofrankia inefficax]
MVRVAAVGDLHVTAKAPPARLRSFYQRAAQVADVLLLAGDLTDDGRTESAATLCALFGGLDLPVVVVLGNHDHDHGEEAVLAEMLTGAGLTVLDGTSTVVDTAGGKIGIAGVKGTGGGFAGDPDAEPGDTETRAFSQRAATSARQLRDALERLDVDLRVALTHFAPTPETLRGEPQELYPFLGNDLLGAAIDGEPAAASAAGPGDAGGRPVALAVHGHAHYGIEVGRTAAGTAVRNVALPVIRAPFAVYRLPDVVRVG